MTNQNLYDAALRMASEVAVVGENADYAERATYLLAAGCSQCLELDRIYRKIHELPEGTGTVTTCLALTDDFPLSDVFAPGMTYYLASMLVIDENEEMSDKLFALYSDAMSKIQNSLPLSSEKIKNAYPGLLN